MNDPFGKFLSVKNRLEKVHRHLSKQARRQGISCYRLYDHDLPEAPLLIELYGNKVYVSEYERRHNLSEDEHTVWLQQCIEIIAEVTGLSAKDVFVRQRQRKEGRLGQYQKLDEAGTEFAVEEGGLKFLVNLTNYLDTGLFLDHRITRGMVRERSKGKRVLNLFCYTGSFSVYAVAGGASVVTSVDLSKTYLAWTERNIVLNFPNSTHHQTVHADAIEYVKEAPSAGVDLIILDPPTFSNSKRMDGVLDIQRDHPLLINHCLRILAPNGELYFSTNYTKFQLDTANINTTNIRDITKATTPFDFAGKLKRQCYCLTP